MLDLLPYKIHDESRQGESISPVTGDQRVYSKRFYIESYGCQMNFSDIGIDTAAGLYFTVDDGNLVAHRTSSGTVQLSTADGVVVGSRAVQVAEEGPEALRAYVASLRAALDA